ncbi:hypothetical protein [Aeromonas dhakensis]|uniref:hypothetical protein n=2 Tax=Aeromonas TaxID=642 RepID=UPI003B9FDFA7
MANKEANGCPQGEPDQQEEGTKGSELLGQMKDAIEANLGEVQLPRVDVRPPLAAAEETALGQEDQTDTDKMIARAGVLSTHADTQDKKSQTRLREQLTSRVFTFMERWCAYVALIFWLYFSTKKGDVPSEVMIALLTTTTVSVIGLVGFIVKGLFKTNDSSSDGKSS